MTALQPAKAQLLQRFPVGTRVRIVEHRTICARGNLTGRTGVVIDGHFDGWYVRLDPKPRERTIKEVLVLSTAKLEALPCS